MMPRTTTPTYFIAFSFVLVPILLVQNLTAHRSFWQSIPEELLSMYLPDTADSSSSVIPREDTSFLINTPPHVNGGFIHIGKTGGSTLSHFLRHGCHSFLPHPCRIVPHESQLSKRITQYYHVPDFGKLKNVTDHDFYVITTRDPLERTLSAFVYEHYDNFVATGRIEKLHDDFKIQKQEAYECFPTLEAFTFHLNHTTKTNNNDNPSSSSSSSVVAPSIARAGVKTCHDLAVAVMDGKIRQFRHFFFSFQKIKKFLTKQQQKQQQQRRQRQQQPQQTKKYLYYYIIRQEHLWEDWETINVQYFHQTTPVFQNRTNLDRLVKRNESSVALPVTKDISPTGLTYLCRALQKEYQAYFWFFKQAHNLNQKDIQEAQEKAKRNCPHLNMETIMSVV